jgi:cyclopropane fatty-acyl-phospholipid synthase-like methyltransferase
MEFNRDMYTGTKYFANNPTWDVEDSSWKADIIYELVRKNGLSLSEVVEIGCGAGGILEKLSVKDENIKSLKGYDISPDAIRLAKAKENERLTFFNDDFLANEYSLVDLILVIDVVEHISDFYKFLEMARRKGKQFIFHIPLDLSCRTILKPHVMLQQRQAVGHLHYFSKEMVEWALRDTGYTIVDWLYTKPVTDIRTSSSFKQAAKKRLRNLSFALNKDISVKLWGNYSMMILAQ